MNMFENYFKFFLIFCGKEKCMQRENDQNMNIFFLNIAPCKENKATRLNKHKLFRRQICYHES